MDGIFFVVDASDTKKLGVAQEVLHEMVRHPALANREIPLCILANKQDIDISHELGGHGDKNIDSVEMRNIMQVDKL